MHHCKSYSLSEFYSKGIYILSVLELVVWTYMTELMTWVYVCPLLTQSANSFSLAALELLYVWIWEKEKVLESLEDKQIRSNRAYCCWRFDTVLSGWTIRASAKNCWWKQVYGRAKICHHMLWNCWYVIFVITTQQVGCVNRLKKDIFFIWLSCGSSRGYRIHKIFGTLLHDHYH